MNWIYDKGDPAIRTEDDKDVILYTDRDPFNNLNIEVLNNVVIMHNQNASIEQIDNYLLNEELCTQDERELIIEEIAKF